MLTQYNGMERPNIVPGDQIRIARNGASGAGLPYDYAGTIGFVDEVQANNGRHYVTGPRFGFGIWTDHVTVVG